MSVHSYSRVWLHLVWGTLERRPLLRGDSAPKLSAYLHDYAKQKGIYMKINFANPDHVHALIDLPTSLSIEAVMQLLKGGSSHWMNEQNLVPEKFGWGRGYGVFSVSESNVAEVANYIANQTEHHLQRPFAEELKLFAERHGLEWRND
jgi:REP element-mobilizing transposase RayT